jgi:hypothetical protein
MIRVNFNHVAFVLLVIVSVYTGLVTFTPEGEHSLAVGVVVLTLGAILCVILQLRTAETDLMRLQCLGLTVWATCYLCRAVHRLTGW